VLTLREEHLVLLPGDPRAEAVAGQVRLVDEVLAEDIEIDAGCCGLAGSFDFESEHSGLSRGRRK
jgi:Fe-S oxidoreductase